MENNNNKATAPINKKGKKILGKVGTIALMLSILYWVTLFMVVTHPYNETRTELINMKGKHEFLKDFHKPIPKSANSFHQKKRSSDQPISKKADTYHYNKPEKAPSPVLTAYLETIDQDEWKIKPLPIRKNAQASKLKKITYPNLQSCKNLPSQWPVDNYPDDDPFLPWIHDVFPSNDGTVIHFVSQNKRRCRTGDNPESEKIKKHMQPQVSLFQHIPVKRINPNNDASSSTTTRYRLASHEEADPDALHTRFICRFKPSNIETLSTFRFDYNYAAFRKRYQRPFTEEGFDNHVIWTS